MSSTQSAINQRAPTQPAHPRHSKITVEYHRPSRESIIEYNELLAEASVHAAAAASYQDPFIPSRQAPPPPVSPTVTSVKSSAPASPRVRNSLHKPSPQRKHSSSQKPIDLDPFAATNSPMSGTTPPPRPSRANTANLTDIFPTQHTLARHRLSDPAGLPPNTPTYAYENGGYSDSQEAQSHPPLPPMPIDVTGSNQTSGTVSGMRSRSGTTTTKSKKGMFNFMSDFLNSSKRLEISTPYDPVHLTHVGFNSSTGEFTGLPKEWQQLLQDSGISKSDQEKNPEAVMEIVKFYQEGRGEASVWDKMGAIPAPQPTPPQQHQRNGLDEGFGSQVSCSLSGGTSSVTDFLGQRTAPPPPKSRSTGSLGGAQQASPASYRPAPAPPAPLTPSLDRSTSQRLPNSKSKSADQLTRAHTTRDRHSPGPGQQAHSHARTSQHGPLQATSQKQAKSSPSSSQTDLTGKSSPAGADKRQQQGHAPSPSSATVQKAAAAGVATPRRRKEKGDKDKEADIVKRLQAICTPADPTKLYRNLVKIGAG